MGLDKQSILDASSRYFCPGRVRMLGAVGIDLVIGRREGYRIWDIDGRELIDCHLNGGVFNLGHRNPEALDALRGALESLDIGNHHFPSVARAELGETLARLTPGELQFSVFASGGGEAIDAAIKSARHATKRRKIVSIDKAYHGHTGLALAVGEERYARMFLSDEPKADYAHVPFNDLESLERELANNDAAAVILETIPATLGFPMPDEGYLGGVRSLCTRYGALYIADEVQTGLGRTGRLWGVDSYGVVPDVLVTGKGLSGGLYPIAAAVLSPKAAAWLEEDGWGHVSTFGGSEVGCRVALKVLEITTRPEVVANAVRVSEILGGGLRELQRRYGEWFVEVRARGLVMGLRFGRPDGALLMAKALYDSGLWAMFAAYDRSVLQFKPGLLLDERTCSEILERFETGLRRCVAGLR